MDHSNRLNKQLPLRDNCLNTVRLIAAINVMYGHIRVHLAVTMPQWLNVLIAFFRGVPIFYVLSGFLIWQSVAAGTSLRGYLGKRFWRIYPELWCGVVLGFAAILCLFDEPIQWLQMTLFTLTQSTALQFWTPDFLRSYGCGTPNGTLGTICILVQFYLAVWWIYRALHGKKPWVWLTVLAGFVAVSTASNLLDGILPTILFKLTRQTAVPYLWLFVLGMTVAEFKDFLLPALKKWWLALLGISAVFYLLAWDINAGYGVIRSTTMGLGLLGFAYALPQLNIKTDISYGIFVYHMIVVNAMIELGYVEKSGYLLIAAALSLCLAFVSHKTVGRLCEKQKGKIDAPGRR